MGKDTLYFSVQKGEPLRTRAILPYSLVKYYNLDIALSDPDEHFPSEYPAALVPAFRYADGRPLTESIPIALKLADEIQKKSPILGDGSEITRALILQWLNILNIELMDYVAIQYRMILGRAPFDRAVWGPVGGAVAKALRVLDEHLTKNTYLVGETVTLADLYGIPMLLRGLQRLWGPEIRARYPAVMRWFNTVSKSPVYDGFFDTLEFTKESDVPEEMRK